MPSGRTLPPVPGRGRDTLLRGFALVAWLLLATAPAGAASLCTAVQGPHGARGFVLGTIHMEDVRLQTLPPSAQAAFDMARTVAVEAVLDPAAVAQATRLMMYADGRTLRAAVGDALYRDTLAVAARHTLPSVSIEHMKPWAVAAALGTPPARGGVVLDLVLQRRALQAGKTVVALETVAEQLAIFDALDAQAQVELLRETVARYDEFPGVHAALLEAYLRRDLDTVTALAQQYVAAGAAPLADLLYTRLIVERNRRMAARARPLFDAGPAFVAVGALHLPGPDGLLALLERAGFELVPGC